jgi:histidine ammonia-lyase
MTALRIGDVPLTPAAVAAAARSGKLEVVLTGAARERLAAGHAAAEAAAAQRPVYGRTTGVGANRDVAVDGDLHAHTLRLLRSHAGGVGEPLPEEVVRATVLVRLAQLAAGGSGSRPELAAALAELVSGESLPELRDLGGIGTGDLAVLAQLGLALPTLAPGDALPLMSSNAATLGTAALAWADLRELLDAGLGVAALSFRAVRGNPEAYAAALADARPLPGLAAVSGRLRALTAGSPEPARLQDPFALRCLPQVGGALHDALAGLGDVLAVDINAAAENPLFAAGEALHHGGFHAASAALQLDALRLALVPFATLSVARLSQLMIPELSGLTPFLAADAPGSSGLMITEYLATDALERLRGEATPALLASVSISRGMEEHASFAWQSAGRARQAVGHLRTVLALEWIAAERALRRHGIEAAGALAPLRALAAPFDPSVADRPLGDDAARAVAALPALADAVRAVSNELAGTPTEPLH